MFRARLNPCRRRRFWARASARVLNPCRRRRFWARAHAHRAPVAAPGACARVSRTRRRRFQRNTVLRATLQPPGGGLVCRATLCRESYKEAKAHTMFEFKPILYTSDTVPHNSKTPFCPPGSYDNDNKAPHPPVPRRTSTTTTTRQDDDTTTHTDISAKGGRLHSLITACTACSSLRAVARGLRAPSY